MSKPDTLATQALERAAHAAFFGSREARSGRFNLAFTDEKRAAGIILREAQAAYQSWANWEAINDQFSNQGIRDTVVNLELGAIGSVRAALGRDALLRAFALSDVYDAKGRADRLTLSRFALLFEDTSMSAMLASDQWALDLGHARIAAKGAADENKVRIDRFQSLIVADWSKAQPSDRAFGDLRLALRPIRNRLAHAIDVDFDAPTLDQVRRFMCLTLELATDMAFLFLGNAVSTHDFDKFSRERADKFWAYALRSA
jgi:hypothetical protein